MKNDLTELVFILDRSGSMAGLESGTIGGYNGFLDKQRALPGEALVTTVLFDDRYELLHDRIALPGVRPVTDRDYFVRGSTALLDAVGRTIEKIANAHQHTGESQRPGKTLFVVTTDGLENASREFTFQRIQQMITRQKEEFGWEFLFLGANIDAAATAGKMGIQADRAVNFHADSQGTKLNYQVLSDAAGSVRAGTPLGADWKESINEDFRSRAPKK